MEVQMRGLGTNLKPEQQLAEVEDLLRTIPTWANIRNPEPENYAWCGRAVAVVNSWDAFKAAELNHLVKTLHSGRIATMDSYGSLMTILHQMRYDLRMKTVGPLSVAIAPGRVFDYFDEVRKVIEGARIDVLFIDAYLDAEFVSKYLPYVTEGVTVRLLCGARLKTLLPAVESFKQQSGLAIEVKSYPDFHDRYLIIDNAACYQSGASFKDGAKTAPTTLTQIGDAFKAVQSTYEGFWAAGKVH